MLNIPSPESLSNTHNNGNNDRSFHRPLQEEFGDIFGEIFAGYIEVGRAWIAERGFDALAHDEPRLVHEFFVALLKVRLLYTGKFHEALAELARDDLIVKQNGKWMIG